MSVNRVFHENQNIIYDRSFNHVSRIFIVKNNNNLTKCLNEDVLKLLIVKIFTHLFFKKFIFTKINYFWLKNYILDHKKLLIEH